MERFTALVDFFSEETKSQYLKGMSYKYPTIPGVLDKWLAEGKIELGGPQSKVMGAGEVK